MPQSLRSELNADEQVVAQRRLLGFYWLNGIAVTLVMENIMLLWALRNGLSAPLVAVISSFIFLSMPFMLLGRGLSARLGLVRAWSLCWAVRYLFVLAMIPAPWLRGTAWERFIPALIVGCTFGLFAVRNMGMINSVPVMGAVVDRHSQGSFQAGSHLRSQIAYGLSLMGVMALLHWRDTLGMYQILLALGCVVGLISAAILNSTPEPVTLRLGARLRLRTVVRTVAGNKSFGRLALVWCAAATMIALVAPMGMLAVKRGYGLADDTALAFTLVELTGGILATTVISILADHTGPRPLILMAMSLFVVAAAFWAFAPARFMAAAVVGVFLVVGVAKGTLGLSLSHYLLAASQIRERMGVSIFMQMSAGVTSGLAGAVIAGGLLKWLTPRYGEGLALYHVYYRVVLALAVPLFLVAFALPRLKDWTVRNVIGLIFSFNDLRALGALNRLRRDSSDDEDVQRLDELTSLASRHSEPHLREFLESGRLVTRARALNALGRIQFGEETVTALIREVREGAFTNGWRAAELLGQRGATVAIPALREGLQSEDPYLAGKCMVALARLKSHADYAAIRALCAESTNPRIVIQGAAALEAIRDPADIGLLLDKCIERAWPVMVLDELLLAAAALAGRKRQLYRYFKVARPGMDHPPATPPGPPPAAPPPNRAPLWAFLARQRWEDLPPRVAAALAAMLAEE